MLLLAMYPFAQLALCIPANGPMQIRKYPLVSSISKTTIHRSTAAFSVLDKTLIKAKTTDFFAELARLTRLLL